MTCAFLRVISVVTLTGVLASASVVAPAASSEQAPDAPRVELGTFGVGGSLAAGIDPRTGTFSVSYPLMVLPGMLPAQPISLGVTYRQDAAERQQDMFALGAGWAWTGVPFVTIAGGVWVSPSSGGMYEADKSTASGLADFPSDDVRFIDAEGTLEATETATQIPYRYALGDALGTSFFSTAGLLVAYEDIRGARTVYEWDEANSHRLRAVTDNAGTRLSLSWGESGVSLSLPPRSDGVVTTTSLALSEYGVTSMVSQAGDVTELGYGSDSRLLERILSPAGAETRVKYSNLHSGSGYAASRVHVTDLTTGQLLSDRQWGVVGEHTAEGFPRYTSEGELRASGDGAYRYRTRLSDGATHVDHEYNSLGLLMVKDVTGTGSMGDVHLQRQSFEYVGSVGTSVPAPGSLQANFSKPTTTRVTYMNTAGGSREVSERREYDERGREISATSVDGAVTTTVYDDAPVGRLRVPGSFVRESKTVGADGAAAVTRNIAASDGVSVLESEDLTIPAASSGDAVLAGRVVNTVDGDGFISEQRIISPSFDATENTSAGAEESVTRFTRDLDPETRTLILTETIAPGTSASATVTSRVDLVSGLTIAQTDAGGRSAYTSHDRAGRVVSATDASGLTTTTSYSRNTVSATDPRGITTVETVDALGRVIETRDNLVNRDGVFVVDPRSSRVTETRSYSSDGARVTVTDISGRVASAETDVFGRVTRTVGLNGVENHTRYDDVANTVSSARISGDSWDEAEFVSHAHRDPSGRVIQKKGERRDGVAVPTATAAFDGLGRQIAERSGDIDTRRIFNADGSARTTTMTPAMPDVYPGEETVARRDHRLGQSVKKTLSRGDDSSDGVLRSFDEVGRVISVTDQAGQITRYSYTSDGLVERVFDEASGTTTRMVFDPVTRAVTQTESSAPGKETARRAYEYDVITGALVGVWDPSTVESTASSRLRFTYDVVGNETEISYPDGARTAKRYDDEGRLHATTDVAGNLTENEYDELGLLRTVQQRSATGDVLARVDYSYDAFGRVRELAHDNGMTTSYTYSSTDQVTTESTRRGSETIFAGSYEYDSHDNLVQKTQTLAGPDSAGATTSTTSYRYNAYDQLIESREYEGEGTTSVQQVNYDIGVTGNVVRETVKSRDGKLMIREFDTNKLGQTTAVTTLSESQAVRQTQEYDAAGNLVRSVNGTTYAYNVANQLVEQVNPDGETVAYDYWAHGKRRIARGATADTTLYWDGDAIINDTHRSMGAELNGVRTASYLAGVQRHARIVDSQNDGASRYVNDRHGNVVALADQEARVTASYRYSDYGVTTRDSDQLRLAGSAERNPFEYAGEYTRPDGTQELGPRVFQPDLMTFTTRDTADQFNLYSYGSSNPITLVDPSGQTAEVDAGMTGLLIG